jgi:hypothetical protein
MKVKVSLFSQNGPTPPPVIYVMWVTKIALQSFKQTSISVIMIKRKVMLGAFQLVSILVPVKTKTQFTHRSFCQHNRDTLCDNSM